MTSTLTRAGGALARLASLRYGRRLQPVAAALAVVAMAAMVMAVLQFQGPLMRRPAPARAPQMQLCQSVDPQGNGVLYTASHC